MSPGSLEEFSARRLAGPRHIPEATLIAVSEGEVVGLGQLGWMDRVPASPSTKCLPCAAPGEGGGSARPSRQPRSSGRSTTVSASCARGTRSATHPPERSTRTSPTRRSPTGSSIEAHSQRQHSQEVLETGGASISGRGDTRARCRRSASAGARRVLAEPGLPTGRAGGDHRERGLTKTRLRRTVRDDEPRDEPGHNSTRKRVGRPPHVASDDPRRDQSSRKTRRADRPVKTSKCLPWLDHRS